MDTQTGKSGETNSQKVREPRIVGALFVLFAWLLFGASSSASDSEDTKRVLVLYSFKYGLPANELVDANSVVGRGIRSIFENGTTDRIAFYSERMDVSALSDDRYFGQLRDVYRERYAGERIDVIIAVNYRALSFLIGHAEELWPTVPIVFCGVEVNRREQLKDLGPNITGVLQESGLRNTLDTILEIHPDTRRITVVVGTSETDLFIEGVARQAFREYADQIEFKYLDDLAFNAILNSVADLPPKSIVLFLSLLQDGDGKPVPMNALPLVSRASNVPVYGMFDAYVGHGIVGGRVASFENQGSAAAKMGLRILTGEKPEEIPIRQMQPQVNLYDWRELRRWDISEDRLPHDSTILFKEESLWDRYKWSIVSVVGLCVLEGGIVFTLVLNWVKYRRVNSTLRESEQRFRLIMDSLPVLVAQVDSRQRYVFGNADYEKLFGVSGERITGRLVEEVLGEELHRRVRPQIESALSGHQEVFERAVPVPGAGSRHLRISLVPHLGEKGETLGYYVLGSDVTEAREAQEAVRARWEELARVARITTMGELAASIAHEINQPLCAIVSNAETAQRLVSAEVPDTGEVHEILKDIVADGNRSTGVVARIRALIRGGEPRRDPLDINQLIRDVVSLVESDTTKQETTIRLDLTDNLPLVLADHIQLQQVIVNLVFNAAQAMEEVADSSRIIVIQSSAADTDAVTVAVQDDGAGLNPEHEDRVFDAFFTTKPDGMGMGLSISRTIVESLGGRLWATQNTDRGATFHFSLPTKQKKEANEPLGQ